MERWLSVVALLLAGCGATPEPKADPRVKGLCLGAGVVAGVTVAATDDPVQQAVPMAIAGGACAWWILEGLDDG